MPRETEIVRPDGVKARVVTFEKRAEREPAQRTEEEIEWRTFKHRWARWKRQYGFSPPDPSNLQSGISG